MLQILMRVVIFAFQKHAGQFRHGTQKIPYITHPFEVAQFVSDSHGTLAATCGALLHDTMEDCGVTDEEILALFSEDPPLGRLVLQIVKEHTDPPELSYPAKKEREIKMMANGDYLHETATVILADQLSNVTDLVRTPPLWGKGEEQQYIEQMERLVNAGRHYSPFLANKFDEAAKKARVFYGMKEK